MTPREQRLADAGDADRALAAAALAACAQAWAPYSRFRVGAALRFTDGSRLAGANFENLSYGLSLCAETVAVASANAAGRLRDIAAIAIAATGTLDGAESAEFIAPCGRCRQVLAEAAQAGGCDIEVLMLSRDGTRLRRARLSELLPLAFGA